MRTQILTVLFAVGLPTVALADAPDPKTERTWKATCQPCHGADGKGQTEQGKKLKAPDFTSAEWQKAHGDEEMKKAITDGVNAEGKEIHKKKFAPAEADKLLAFVRAFAGK
jgi:cytochrome c